MLQLSRGLPLLLGKVERGNQEVASSPCVRTADRTPRASTGTDPPPSVLNYWSRSGTPCLHLCTRKEDGMSPIRVAVLALLVSCCGHTLYAQTIGACFSCATKINPLEFTLEAICCKPQWVDHDFADCDILARGGWAIADLNLNTCEVRQTNREGESEPLVKYCAGSFCDSGGAGGEEDPGGRDPSEGEGGGGHIDPFEPIMVHLGPGLPRLSSPEDGVIFAVSGPGDLWRLAWPLGNRTAFLVVDRNGNGQIDDMSEMFGNFTSMQTGGLA